VRWADLEQPRPEDREEWRQAAETPLHLAALLAKYHGLNAYEGERLELYEHLVEVSHWLAALSDGYLYASGPGPKPVITATYRHTAPGPDYGRTRTVRQADWWTPHPLHDDRDWQILKQPAGRHPRTGEPTIHRLNIEMSPGLGKSTMCSTLLPWWYTLTRAQQCTNVIATHTKDFAEGALAKRLINYASDYGRTIGMTLAREAPGAKNIEFSDPARPGERSRTRFFGVGEAITGNRVVGVRGMDDPVAGWERVNEEGYLDKQYQYYKSPWDQRWKNMPGEAPNPEFIVMSRWDPRDIVGRVVYEDDDHTKPKPGWGVLHFDPLVEGPDGAEASVCEQMFSAERFRQWRDDDPHSYAAQALCSPVPAGEGSFPAPGEWPAYRPHPSDGDTLIPTSGPWAGEHVHVDVRFATIDVAGKAEANDWTAVCVWDYNRDRQLLFLRHAARAKRNTTDHMDFLRSQTATWQARKPLDCCLVEDIGFGVNLLQSQNRDTLTYLGFPLEAPKRPTSYTGLTGKAARIRNYATAARRGHVLVPEDRFPQFHHWMNEHLFWPQTPNDDWLDCGADAVYQRVVYPGGNPPEPEARRPAALWPVHDRAAVEKEYARAEERAEDPADPEAWLVAALDGRPDDVW